MHEAAIDYSLPHLRSAEDRADARERLPAFLYLRRLRLASQAEGRGLLRLLLVRRRALPADAGGIGARTRSRLLRRCAQLMAVRRAAPPRATRLPRARPRHRRLRP